LNSNRSERALLVEKSGHADDAIESEQRESDGDVIEVHFPSAEPPHEVSRQGVNIDLQPHGERGPGTYPWADSTETFALDRFMKSERIAPERLVSEGVESEGLSTLSNHSLCVPLNRIVALTMLFRGIGLLRGHGKRPRDRYRSD
jgi:hypothetical protein